jgi:hypothetical protein
MPGKYMIKFLARDVCAPRRRASPGQARCPGIFTMIGKALNKHTADGLYT